MPRPPQGMTPARRAVLQAAASLRAAGQPITTGNLLPMMPGVPFRSSLDKLIAPLLDWNLLRQSGGGGPRQIKVYELTDAGERALGLLPGGLRLLSSAVYAGAPAALGEVDTRLVERLGDVIDYDAQLDMLVEIKGDSMDRAGILDGDRILVRELSPEDEKKPRDGDIVAGFLETHGQCEWTVKFFVELDSGVFAICPYSTNPKHRITVIGRMPPDESLLARLTRKRRGHRTWDWLPESIATDHVLYAAPDAISMNWVWTGGLIRPPARR